MKLSSLSNALKEAFANVIRNRLMTIATIVTLSAGLFLFGLASALTLNVFSITNKLQTDFKLEIYIDEAFDMNNQTELEENLRALSNVADIEYIPNEVAFEELKNDFPAPEMLEGLEDSNVLRDAYRITLKDLSISEQTVAELEGVNGVAKVSQLANKMQTFLGVINKVQITTVSIGFILGLLAILIITNTINMSIYARKKQITIMKYVGATDGYIRLPFILEGLYIGLFSALVSYAGVFFLYNPVIGAMGSYGKDMGVLMRADAAMPLAAIIGGMGILLGCLGSSISIRKHLKV